MFRLLLKNGFLISALFNSKRNSTLQFECINQQCYFNLVYDLPFQSNTRAVGWCNQIEIPWLHRVQMNDAILDYGMSKRNVLYRILILAANLIIPGSHWKIYRHLLWQWPQNRISKSTLESRKKTMYLILGIHRLPTLLNEEKKKHATILIVSLSVCWWLSWCHDKFFLQL